jgi:NAD(P)-dependent dehydrogenase (short-subunit alcohol dehydrogenase family)
VKSVALELGKYHITVNAVVPGLIATALTRHRQRYAQAIDDLATKLPAAELERQAVQRLTAKTPLGVPWLQPEQVAPVVVFLASDAAAMVTGATYDVTGGDILLVLPLTDASRHVSPPVFEKRIRAGTIWETATSYSTDARHISVN